MPYFKFGDLIRDIKNGRYKDAFEVDLQRLVTVCGALGCDSKGYV